jgi:uncharacterized damage-inducible protein DinB
MEVFFSSYAERLDALHEGMKAALDRVPREGLDWRPADGMNSLAVLAAHTAGSERFWIGEVAGERPQSRVRETEFKVQGRDAAHWQGLLDQSLALAMEVLDGLSLADMAQERAVPGRDEGCTVAYALLHALEHTAQHMGHMQIGRQLWDEEAAYRVRRRGPEPVFLTPEAFALARDYIFNHGRALEQELFRYEFEEGDKTAVVEALSAYANPDGGFGQALEPDVRTPSSSALATEIALRHLIALEVPAKHPLVAGALRYLQDTYDPQTKTWRVIPEDSNDYPHAPWWHDDEDGSLARTFDEFEIIPRAGLVAALHAYREALPPGWLDEIAEDTAASILRNRSLGEGGGDDLVYAFRLADSGALVHPLVSSVYEHLLLRAQDTVNRYPDTWDTYGLKPLKLAGEDPDAPVATLLDRGVQRQLNYEIEHQHEDGAWNPNWDWGEAYPEAWVQAREEWCGELTLAMLKALRAYGRLAS